MQTLGSKIRYLREKKNMTQTELSQKLGMKTYTTVSKWENNENFPKGKDLKELAELFGVSADYLLGLSENNISSIETIYNKLEPPRQVKVYDFAEEQLQEQTKKIIHHDFSEKRFGELRGILSAGTGISNYYEDITDEESFEWEEIEVPTDAPINFDYLYAVSGNSMEPIFCDKDIVYVKELNEEERSSLDTQGIYVVRVNGESYIKKIRFTEYKMHLISLNKEYKEIVVNEFDNVKVVAKVLL